MELVGLLILVCESYLKHAKRDMYFEVRYQVVTSNESRAIEIIKLGRSTRRSSYIDQTRHAMSP